MPGLFVKIREDSWTNISGSATYLIGHRVTHKVLRFVDKGCPAVGSFGLGRYLNLYSKEVYPRIFTNLHEWEKLLLRLFMETFYCKLGSSGSRGGGGRMNGGTTVVWGCYQ